MGRKILLTSLSAAESNLPVRYFSVRNEFGYSYCDALLDTEASIKAALARYNIDEIIIIGGANAYDAGDDLKPFPLRQGNALYSADKATLSSYSLLRYRIVQFADELSLDRKAEEERLPPETREKLIRFIEDFQAGDPNLKNSKPNRLFDALSQDSQLWARFWSALHKALPELGESAIPCEQWVKGYLYDGLKPSAKLELLPVNEGVRMRLLSAELAEEDGEWVHGLTEMQKSITEDEEDIDLYVSLNSDAAADTFIVMSVLDILVSMPGSGVNVKKIFTVRGFKGQLARFISDDTDGFGVTELVHATHSFLDYGRADQIVAIWEKSGLRQQSVASMIYAMRHVDMGLSMCNIPEVEDGILRLRQLFRDEKLWREINHDGMLFSVIVKGIQDDYGALLEGDGEIPFIELVKWAYRHQFYQQALTLIESKASENLVKSGIFYYCDDEKNVAHVTRLFAEKLLEFRPYEYYKMDPVEYYFIKGYDHRRSRGFGGQNNPHRAYGSIRVQSIGNTDPALITGFTACDDRKKVENVLAAYDYIGDVRNKISHANAQLLSDDRLMVSESDESAALLRTKESIEYFIDCYEKAMAEVQGKNPHVVLITTKDVKKVAEQMRYEKRSES